MSHIYSKEHQRLLKTPIMEKPNKFQAKYKLGFNFYKEESFAIDLEAYNNWLSSQPQIPLEHQSYFAERFKDGEELKEGVHFEIGGGQRKRNRDGTTTRTELVALPIIKEEQSKPNLKQSNMKSGIELIAQERQEQIHKHGFSLEMDRLYYQRKELIQAAEYCLMLADFKHFKGKNIFWPNGWGIHFEHKIINKTTVGKLIVAGAFYMAENDRRGDKLFDGNIEEIAAEIDRLQNSEK